MRDSLRSLLSRPIGAADRTRLGLISVGVLAAVLVAMQLVRNDVTKAPRAPVAAHVEGPATPVATATPDPALAPLPAEGEEADTPPRDQIAAAKRAARAFLRVYLPYSLGRGDPAGIPYATDELRADLAADPPRVPEAQRGRRRRATVELMQVEGASDQRTGLLVMARAGDRRVSFGLQLARYESGWIVFDVER